MSACLQQMITGIICPFHWNSRGKISDYSVFTSNDEDIFLKGENVEKNFIKYKNRRVKIFGHFLKPDAGTRVFKATRTSLEKNVA